MEPLHIHYLFSLISFNENDIHFVVLLLSRFVDKIPWLLMGPRLIYLLIAIHSNNFYGFQQFPQNTFVYMSLLFLLHFLRSCGSVSKVTVLICSLVGCNCYEVCSFGF